MKHRIFTWILAVCMLLSAIPASAEEVTEPTNVERAPGYCGDAIVWSYSDGTLNLTGTGQMDDFPEVAPWAEYKNEIKTVIISGGITYIGAYSFSDYDALTDVQFGKDVYEIGERAFFSCDGLTEVHLPASFKIFGPSSFMGCTKLKAFHCEGKFPSFRQNCLWDTYAVIYFPAERPWSVNNIRDLEEAFHGRIEFLASDGTDPYEPTEPPVETEAPTEAPTEEPTEAPTTVPPTTEAPTLAPETVPAPTMEDTTEAPTDPIPVVTAPTEPESSGSSGGIQIGLILISVVAGLLILGYLVFGGGKKKGRYSR